MPLLITEPFRRARDVLQVAADADAKAIRRAYRKAVASNPPDRDADKFREIRSAYEFLSDPMPRAEQLLMHLMPHASPPPLPDSLQQSEDAHIERELLRAIVGKISVRALLEELETP